MIALAKTERQEIAELSGMLDKILDLTVRFLPEMQPSDRLEWQRISAFVTDMNRPRMKS